MQDKAILVASFGTSHEETRQKNIVELEKEIERNFPQYKIYTAYTSDMVRKILSKKGVEVQDAKTAFANMKSDGITQVMLQPTHLLYGDEFDKLCYMAIESEYMFKSLKISTPLLSDIGDIKNVLNILKSENEISEGEALVLMGHGTEHFCNTVYAAMDYTAKAEGMHNVFVGTVEAYPLLQNVVSAVKKAGFTKALITPLMLVAGDHAVNDMASDDEGSWKTVFKKNGIEPRCKIAGLGQYSNIRKIYINHLKETMGEDK